jgi:hypothetical protein
VNSNRSGIIAKARNFHRKKENKRKRPNPKNENFLRCSFGWGERKILSGIISQTKKNIS